MTFKGRRKIAFFNPQKRFFIVPRKIISQICLFYAVKSDRGFLMKISLTQKDVQFVKRENKS